MSYNLTPVQIPFNSIGFSDTINFSAYGQFTNLPFNSGIGPSWQSGATLRLNNLSDNLLAVIFPRSGIATTLSPGANEVIAIPKNETSCQITVTGCNPFQLYPLETLAPTFYTQQDNVPPSHGGYTSNPNVPASIITPGTFGAGVFVPAANVLPGQFVGGAWQFSSTPANTWTIVLI